MPNDLINFKECKGPEWDALIDHLLEVGSRLIGSKEETNAELNRIISDAGYDPVEVTKTMVRQEDEAWAGLMGSAIVIHVD